MSTSDVLNASIQYRSAWERWRKTIVSTFPLYDYSDEPRLHAAFDVARANSIREVIEYVERNDHRGLAERLRAIWGIP